MTLESPEELRARLSADEQPRTLPPTTRIVVDEVVNGRRYQGEFIFKVPTMRDTIAIGQMKNQYLPGGGAADAHSALLVEQLCYLEVTLQKPRPTWWTPFEFHEQDLITKLYAEGLAYANKFLGRDKDERGPARSDGQEDAGGSGPADEGAVESDVPGADQRRPVVIAHASRAERGVKPAGGAG